MKILFVADKDCDPLLVPLRDSLQLRGDEVWTEGRSKKQLLESMHRFAPDRVIICSSARLAKEAAMMLEKQGMPFYYWVNHLLPRGLFARRKRTIMKKLCHQAQSVLVSSRDMKNYVQQKFLGIKKVHVLGRGIQVKREESLLETSDMSYLPSPLLVYYGRIHRDRNIEDFLDLDLPGTKIVLGDGPHRNHLLRKYFRSAIFLPNVDDAREILRQADVLVFPCKEDVNCFPILEAMSLGLPAAAFNVLGPKSIVRQNITGYLSHSLERSILNALKIKDKVKVQRESKKYSAKLVANALHEAFLSEQ